MAKTQRLRLSIAISLLFVVIFGGSMLLSSASDRVVVAGHPSALITSFLILVFPFVLWRIAMIGRLPAVAPDVARLLSGTTAMDRSGQISLAELANQIPQAYRERFYAAQDKELPPHPRTPEDRKKLLDGLYKLMGVRAFIESEIKRHVESNRFLTINVDLEDDGNAITISSRESEARYLGRPHYVPHGGTSGNSALTLDLARRPRSYDIREVRSKNIGGGILFINGVRIREFHVEKSFFGSISITNCYIEELRFDENNNRIRPRIHINATKIGRMRLNATCCGSMSLRNSYIWKIHYNPTDTRSPFERSLDLASSVDLCVNPERLNSDDLQDYRNLRLALQGRNNLYAASKLRAIELKAERKYESWIVRIINWTYEYSTMYGNSPERACALALVIMIYNGLLVAVNGLYVVNIDCGTKIAESWMGGLCGSGADVIISAALMIGFQPLIDPLGPFRGYQMILPSALWLTSWLWISQLAVLALLAVAAFGVRRRMQY